MESVEFKYLFSYAEECVRTFCAGKNADIVIASSEEIIVYAVFKDYTQRFGKNRLELFVRRSCANDVSIVLGYSYKISGDGAGCFCSYGDFVSIKRFFDNLANRFEFECFSAVQLRLF